MSNRNDDQILAWVRRWNDSLKQNDFVEAFTSLGEAVLIYAAKSDFKMVGHLHELFAETLEELAKSAETSVTERKTSVQREFRSIRCSFCWAKTSDVIAGADVFICHNCVRICIETLNARESEKETNDRDQ